MIDWVINQYVQCSIKLFLNYKWNDYDGKLFLFKDIVGNSDTYWIVLNWIKTFESMF